MEQTAKACVIPHIVDSSAYANAIMCRTYKLIIIAFVCATISMRAAFADSRADMIWQQLRAVYPFHLQTVGLSDPIDDGERVLIIAEPPPTLPIQTFQEALKAIFGDALHAAEIRRQPIGYDGWVEDVVATLVYPAGADGTRRLQNDLAFLGQRLYGTLYKFAPVHLPIMSQVASVAPPTLSVSAAELKDWLLDKNVPLVSLDFGTQHVLRDVLRDGRPGVYLSGERGLAALVLPRDRLINAYRGDIRKFALDTDLIVGAISIGNRLALVGRERDSSVETVPPLRTETILALAATQEGELSQSYERNAATAGKLVSGPEKGNDWAPIYLSRDLINTEFGSLLNITDQMLKSWSEAGHVDYVRFSYKKPETFPFKEGLLHHLFGSDVVISLQCLASRVSLPIESLLHYSPQCKREVVYNWNTVGIGSLFTFGEARIFTLNRTGSLPVSYFPEGSDHATDEKHHAMEAENDAYNYFSQLHDPYLERVVQYTSIYQIFRAFPVMAEREEPLPKNYRAATDVLLAEVRATLKAIENGDAKPQTAYVNTNAESKIRQASEILLEMHNDFGEDITGQIATIMVDRSSLDQNNMEQVRAILFGAPNEEELKRRLKYVLSTNKAALVTALLLLEQEKFKVLQEALRITVDINSVKDRYVHAAAAIDSSYIKTPSIVLSRDVTSEGADLIVGLGVADVMNRVGGHNLYSRATTVETMSSIPQGQIVIETGQNGEKVLRINPEDAPRSNEIARTYERHAEDANVRELVQGELARGGTVREMKVGLAVSDVPPAEGRGLTRGNEGNAAIGEIGFRSRELQPAALRQIQEAADARGLDLLVTRDADGFMVLRLQPRPPYVARTPTEPAMLETINNFAEHTAATRLPSGKPPLRFGVGGDMTESELWGIVKTQELRTSAFGGGGGRKPPSVKVASGAPRDPGPRGRILTMDNDEETACAYAARNNHDDIIVLRVLGKDFTKAEALLRKPVQWGKAEIKVLGSSPGRESGEVQVAFEITVPVKTDSMWSLFWHQNMIVRIVVFFKRALTGESEALEASIHSTISANATQEALADGLVALRSEISRNVNPSDLNFHVKLGTDDLIIVERESGGYSRS